MIYVCLFAFVVVLIIFKDEAKLISFSLLFQEDRERHPPSEGQFAIKPEIQRLSKKEVRSYKWCSQACIEFKLLLWFIFGVVLMLYEIVLIADDYHLSGLRKIVLQLSIICSCIDVCLIQMKIIVMDSSVKIEKTTLNKLL